MRSPFSRYANALLFVPVMGDRIKVDPETGNETPVEEIVEIVAMLNQNGSSKERSLPGVDLSEVFLEGYLVAPMQLPERVRLPLECDAIVDGCKGRIKIRLLMKSSYRSEKKSGRKIQAYFRQSS
ncbi:MULTISPECIES: hypothetical protein [Cyanophyceae]|uniref:hypothetical protein n=1 Tax=Cyanophyceae TaxID=3028117 RepID=UPI0016851A4E|nr:hypothetical protein [Trichocoleus sp. FACHB-40]MBD2005612.1 hypothetical protein [Trichocoleus sp. FACHB-40]